MWYLIKELLPYLLLASIAGAVAGWCWHCIRHFDRFARLAGERERLRGEMIRLLNETPQPQPSVVPIGQEHEMEALRIRADLSSARVSELEAELRMAREASAVVAAPAVDDAPLRARIAELESESVQLNARIEDLGGELAQARAGLQDVDALRARNGLLEAEIASAPREDRAGRWRTRWLESRVEFLQAEKQVLADAPRPADPRVEELENTLANERARLAELDAQLRANPNAAHEGARAHWRARYFEARTRYLEEQARIAPAPLAALAPPEPSAEEIEQANRQRWRSRYLEARVGYLDAKLAEESARPQIAPQELVTRDDHIAELELELEEAVKQRDTLAPQVPALQADLLEADAATRAATDANTALRAEIEALQERLPALQEQSARIAELEGSIAAGRGETMRQKQRIADLEAELAALRAAPKSDPEELTQMQWRARYLENRVAFLERSLSVAPAKAAPTPTRGDEFVPMATDDSAAARPFGLPAPRDGARDDLRLIDGIGPRIESTLNSLGIYHFDQIASWTPANVEWVERYLAFKGRIGRERWIDQAIALNRGDGFEVRRYLESDGV
jgi:predicted flap endonuclease-1-like 5' DNA nuclease